MQYYTMLCIACKYNSSDFKFLFVFFLSEYSRKHDTESGNLKERFQTLPDSGLQLKRYFRNNLL